VFANNDSCITVTSRRNITIAGLVYVESIVDELDIIVKIVYIILYLRISLLLGS